MTNSAHHVTLVSAKPHAFTLVELLVVMAIIALLVGVLLPVLGSSRNTAKQIAAQSGLRQLLLGYTVYRQDHDGHVLFGYTPPTVLGRPVTVTADSGHTFGLPVADRYPWRLAPYVAGVWEVLHHHEPVPELPAAGDDAAAALSKAYALSISPSFGINSVYVGGHGDGPFAGFVTAGGETRPNVGAHVVFREVEVRSASSLIVFTDSRARGGPFTEAQAAGLYFVTPPRANGRRWVGQRDGFASLRSGHLTGLPQGWYGPAASTGFFDGHVASLRPDELNDMRLWANGARDADYDFNP